VDALLIGNYLLDLLGTWIDWLVDGVNALWSTLLPGFPAFVASFGHALGLMKSLNAYLPVAETFICLGLLVGYITWSLTVKWLMQLIDWLPFT
jgi:hypothetical protein